MISQFCHNMFLSNVINNSRSSAQYTLYYKSRLKFGESMSNRDRIIYWFIITNSISLHEEIATGSMAKLVWSGYLNCLKNIYLVITKILFLLYFRIRNFLSVKLRKIKKLLIWVLSIYQIKTKIGYEFYIQLFYVCIYINNIFLALNYSRLINYLYSHKFGKILIMILLWFFLVTPN